MTEETAFEISISRGIVLVTTNFEVDIAPHERVAAYKKAIDVLLEEINVYVDGHELLNYFTAEQLQQQRDDAEKKVKVIRTATTLE